MYKILPLICFVFLTSCTLTYIDSNKDLPEQLVERLEQGGSSTISGQVLLMLDKNKILFGQNTEVLLVPVCDSSTDIITQVYNSVDSGSHPLEDHPRFNWGDLGQYNKFMKTDKRGSFTFRNISSGSYYILSFISLPDKHGDKGSSVMRRISVDRGKIKMVSLRL